MAFKKSFHSDAWAQRWLVSIAVAFTLQACAEIDHVRRAQQTFNQAAQLENSGRVVSSDIGLVEQGDLTTSGVVPAIASARLNYMQVLDDIAQIDAKQEKNLTDAGLWFNVLAIKAMSQWRLGKYDEAKATANSLLAKNQRRLGPRDHAVMKAMPALIRNDAAASMIYRQYDSDSEKYKQFSYAATNLEEASTHMAELRTELPWQHPVGAYLAQAQLAIFINYGHACSRLTAKGDVLSCRGILQSCRAAFAYQALKKHIMAQSRMDGSLKTTFLEGWIALAGLSPKRHLNDAWRKSSCAGVR